MDPAEQRANAVAMLRRAASLPRMKDGRRPPMHGEAGGQSDGERSQSVEKKEDGHDASANEGQPAGSPKIVEAVDAANERTSAGPPTPPVVKDTGGRNGGEDEPQDGATETDKQDTSEAERPTTPAQHSKRRSRSRSRSRGSKDLRKIRQLDIASAAPTAIPSPLLAEGIADDLRSPETPPLNSAQAYLMQLQLAPHLAMVSPLSPFAGGLGAFPGAASPQSPFVPSLQALQNRHLQGLQRSNSAAARMMALNKLTGGAEPLDFGSGASGDGTLGTPGRARLQRNNTVAGEERVAARQHLFRRLNQRNEHTQDKSDVETTSGPEDGIVGLTQKGRRRRSRRKSGSQALVDDREFLGATAAAIAASASSAASAPAFQELYPPLIALPPSRAPSVPLDRQHTPVPLFDAAGRWTPDLQARSPTPLAAAQAPTPSHYQYDSPMVHRGLVVEEEDDDSIPTPPRTAQRHPLGFVAQQRNQLGGLGDGLAAIAASSSAGSSKDVQPNAFSRRAFGGTPRDGPRDDEGDEERVLFGTDAPGLRAPMSDMSASEREISWIADPVPILGSRRVVEESDREVSWVGHPGTNLTSITERDVSWIEPNNLDGRMPFDEDEDDEQEDTSKEPEVLTSEARNVSRPQSQQLSPRDSAQSQVLLIDLEETPDHTPSNYSIPSHHSTTSTATVNTNARESAISSHSETSAGRSDASGHHMGRTNSHSDSLQGWPEMTNLLVEAPALTVKRSADGTSTSTWGRVKGIVRSGSSLGRRSRTNSIAREREKAQGRGDTESSRESAASMVSTRRESRGDVPAPTWQPGAPSSTQTISPSASAALLIVPPPRTGVSPIPPPSDSDAAKYANPKLFPFPGMMRLQEETLRRVVGSASSPDVTLQQSASGTGVEGPMRSVNSSVSSQYPPVDPIRDRKLSHQASDSRLLQKYQMTPVSGAPSSAGAQIDYFNIPQPPMNSLPRTREGVKKWLSARLFPSASQQGVTSPSADHKTRVETTKKPSLSDLLGEKSMDNIGDWDIELDKQLDKGRAPTSTSTNTVIANTFSAKDASKESEISSPEDPISAYQYSSAFSQNSQNHDTDLYDTRESRHLSVPLSSSQDPSSATPDPASSEESPSASSHRSQSSLGSILSPPELTTLSAQANDILRRLDDVLQAESLNRLWSSALTTPPRRLLLSSPMLQVANESTVKDRFLFLFSDVLVIAKPMLPDRDSLHDVQKIYPPDRKFIIKNVVHLKDLHLNVDRDECSQKPTSAVVAQRPEFIRAFVRDFTDSPDAAVSKIIDIRDLKGCTSLGRLLVQLPEIDRAKLGDYLSRRTSKAILKSYIDAFGFVGISIETALRIFLLSIHIPTGVGHSNTLETLLDTFATRWHEANAKITAFGRDFAIRLVRAIVRLNEALHATVSLNSGGSTSSRPHVTSRDFCEAFRNHDTRALVPDSTLEAIYSSVRQEKLCQARNPNNGRAPYPISLKRPIPARITYMRQSEPIVVRIPQPDAQLTVTLHGQGLVFDPPVLSFARTAEASFRVTGTAFGSHTLILACSGLAAPNYARGAPLAVPLAVERTFMRNSFQLAFADSNRRSRRYMFSVDDPIIRLEWTGALRRQIDAARAAAGAGAGTPPELPRSAQVHVYRAAEALAFDVLQETLLAPRTTVQDSTGIENPLPVQRARESYRRSASRSQVYRLGAGKHEGGMSPIPSNSPSPSPSPSAHKTAGDTDIVADDSRLWTGGELTTLCTQNSAIALVLSLLQAALPFDTDNADDTNGSMVIGNGTFSNGYGFGPGAMTNGPAWQHQTHALSAGTSVAQRSLSQSSAYQI